MSLRQFLYAVVALAAVSWTAGAQAVTTIVTGTSPSGGTLTLSLTSPVSTCSFTSDTTFLNPAVTEFFDYPKAAIPFGMLRLKTTGCGIGEAVTFTLEFPQALPATGQWWRYGATPDNIAYHWLPMAVSVDARHVTFTVTDGDTTDDDLLMNGAISLFGALAMPGGVYQDLWWSGPAENGWGMSLVQHADRLFANLYVYDASGAPVWYVMPSGAWDTSRTVFTGALYLPKGSPFYAYDGARFDIGPSVGSLRIAFTDLNNAVMDYTINGVAGRKNITRTLFGPVGGTTDNAYGDLWWAGAAQNGWGLALLQQYSTFFALWFTYDANGKPTWYVMPGGSWDVGHTYVGTAFKAAGPPWVGVQYDASRHSLTNVGSFELRLGSSDAATFNYSIDGRRGSIPLTRIPF